MSILFGPSWTAVVPLTAPRISDEDLARAAECDDMYRKAMAEKWFPWGMTVGLYDGTRHDAATVIQSCFRGWRVRMRTTFNPHAHRGVLRSETVLWVVGLWPTPQRTDMHMHMHMTRLVHDIESIPIKGRV